MDFQDLVGWPLVYIFIALFIILSIFLGVRIVPQSEKHVVERDNCIAYRATKE